MTFGKKNYGWYDEMFKETGRGDQVRDGDKFLSKGVKKDGIIYDLCIHESKRTEFVVQRPLLEYLIGTISLVLIVAGGLSNHTCISAYCGDAN